MKLNAKGLINDRSDDGSESDEIIEEEEERVKEKPVPVAAAKRTGLKGAALSAALLASSDDEEEENKQKNNQALNMFNKLAKTNGGVLIGRQQVNASSNPTAKSGGIYANRLNQTKKKINDIRTTFEKVEKECNDSSFEDLEKSLNEAKRNSNDTDTDDDDSSKSPNNDDDSNSIETLAIHSPNPSKTTNRRTRKQRGNKSASPSPPAPDHAAGKKTNQVVSQQLRELEQFRSRAQLQRLNPNNDPGNTSTNSLLDITVEDLNRITVKVSTKRGVKKFEINENDKFLKVYEMIAVEEETKVENLQLTLKDKLIHLNDTPAGIQLKITDILDCVKAATVVVSHERIRIIENDEEFAELEEKSKSSDSVAIMLQMEEGRKTRVKFFVNKEAQMENVLKKYLEKRELFTENWSDLYFIDFDGDLLDLEETPNDLDLEGGEVMDVKKKN